VATACAALEIGSIDDPLIGQLVAGRYIVRRRLAQGGMGAIYELAHRSLNRRFALKMLSPELASSRQALDRFWREAEIVARLSHPNIVSILDWDQLPGGAPFLVMELLDGEDLFARIERRGRLDIAELFQIADQVLAGLTVAHRAGIVHRDLKPSNVFLATDDAGGERAVLLDFGISKVDGLDTMTGDQEMVGTPMYMAPEQVVSEAGAIGPATDVWAMGAILFEMATGERAFAGDNLPAIMHRICHERAAPLSRLRPDTPPALDRLVMRALDPDPARRPRDAEELRRQLADIADSCIDLTVTDVELALAATAAPEVAVEFALAATGAVSTAPPPATPAPVGRRRSQRAALVGSVLAIAAAFSFALVVPGDSTAPAALVAGAGQPLRVGVTSSVSPDRLAAQVAPVVRHLEARIGSRVELLVVRDYAELTGRVVRGDIDVAWLPALEYVRAARLDPGLRPLAVPVERQKDPHYQGIILAKKGRGIDELGDLVGARFCYVSPTSASGYLYPRQVLRRAGFDPDSMFREAEFLNEHRRVLEALDTGRCDAAATYEGMLQSADQLGYRPDSFVTLAGTVPIPFGPYVASSKTPGPLADRIGGALLELAPGSRPSRDVFAGQGEFAGFEPVDDGAYDSLRQQAAETARPVSAPP
jgi:eukaryotic-like serine/threonine-protein kinase